ncbi:methylglyoxal synthase [Fulvitalea axinellae]|uniref:Methylglyoxal synthase n=1 Tax=Fulvitalea axinellae TaxID=1182444 RepID=A0AAU9D635_9BACT|nr:methylglyoxal synthase [Fulvitalea axinellae]
MKTKILPKRKNIAIVAHDNKKQEMVSWAERNRDVLRTHRIFATGTTGKLIEEALDAPVHKFMSGPLGGDQQIGARIADGEINAMFFFWDPLEAQPHEPDVKALLRIAVLYNIPLASNTSSADFILKSPLFDEEYDMAVMDFEDYLNRSLPK